MAEKNSLKFYLREKNLTVKEFAILAGLNKRSLDVYVSGTKSFDRSQLWFALKVADALGIDPHQLLTMNQDKLKGDTRDVFIQ